MKKSKKLNKGALIFVHWTDILSNGGKWFDPQDRRREMQEEEKGPQVTSVGFVLDATRNYLAVSQSVAIVTGGDAMNAIKIPWGCIRSVSRLKVGKDYK